MTTGAALLQDLTARGVVLTAESGRLRYRAPAGALTPDLWRQLEGHKAALVALLSAQQTSLFDGAAPSPDAGPLVPHVASQAAQDPHAGRLVLTDREQVLQRLAALEAEIDAGAASLAHLPKDDWPAELLSHLNVLAREADRLAAVLGLPEITSD